MAQSGRPPRFSPVQVQAGLTGAVCAMIVVVIALTVGQIVTGTISKASNIAVLAANIAVLVALAGSLAANSAAVERLTREGAKRDESGSTRGGQAD